MFGTLFKLLITMGFSLGLYIGCSEVGFEEGLGPVCQQLRTDDLVESKCLHTDDGYEKLIYPDTVSVKLDLLFVIDNSGSMSPEQRRMANDFSAFISQLNNSTDAVSYQVGIITTEIGNKGTLINFSNGKNIISNDPSNHYYEANAGTLFQNAITRTETLVCEQSNYDINKCPSGLESGIKNVNHFLDKGYSSFFRNKSLFSVVIISDEDENSRGERTEKKYWPNKVRTMQAYNRPKTLIDKIGLQLNSTKKFSFNAVIVKDRTCLEEQNRGIRCGDSGTGATQWFYKSDSTKACQRAGDRLRGSCFKKPCAAIGNVYKKLVDATNSLGATSNILPGSIGNICGRNYSQRLKGIANTLNSYLKRVHLHCNPLNAQLEVRLNNPNPRLVSRIKWKRNARSVSFYKSGSPEIISLPKNTKILLNYKCLRSI